MDREDVKKLLTLLQAEYPHSFSQLDDRQMTLKVELWSKEFELDESKMVYTATRLLMREGREFAPTSGQIREKMQSLVEPDYLDEQQAWSLVSRACSNGLYGYEKEYRKLPPDVQRAVGRPEQLREWAAMDAETVQSVVASNFMRSYRAGVARQKEIARLPEEVRMMIAGISEARQLMEG